MDEIEKDIKIMVVDDEEVIRELIGEILEIYGYQPILMESPKKAVTYYRENHEAIDLLLIDMIMPELTGVELFYEIKAIDSEQKVILLSGFSDEIKARQMMIDGIVGFVQKPVSIEELTTIIKKSLEN